MAQLLNRMERDGLITRYRDTADQRRTVVQATAHGQALVNTLSKLPEQPHRHDRIR